jgi:uncharacterized membrane protein YhiD involved in acid resistance
MEINELSTMLAGNQASLSMSNLLLSLAIGLLLSIAIRWHFVKFGSTLSNREEFAQVFPFILMTTILIITVVKSSIALSLGLVGALSIVRFRTPIKEPEELAYLFISIAAGLGLGANQIIPTFLSVIVILVFMVLLNYKWRNINHVGKKLFIAIDMSSEQGTEQEGFLDFTNGVMDRYTKTPDLRRYDIRDDFIEILYLVSFIDDKSLSKIISEIKSQYPGAGVTFLDQNNLPGV